MPLVHATFSLGAATVKGIEIRSRVTSSHDNMDRVEQKLVKSQAIRAVGYEDPGQTLEIEFTSGRIYRYLGVPRSLYDWLLRSPSKGGIFNRMIRDRYEEIDVTPVPEQDLEDALRRSLSSESEE